MQMKWEHILSWLAACALNAWMCCIDLCWTQYALESFESYLLSGFIHRLPLPENKHVTSHLKGTRHLWPYVSAAQIQLAFPSFLKRYLSSVVLYPPHIKENPIADPFPFVLLPSLSTTGQGHRLLCDIWSVVDVFVETLSQSVPWGQRLWGLQL